jgi:hypothetical protein
MSEFVEKGTSALLEIMGKVEEFAAFFVRYRSAEHDLCPT